MSLTAPLPAAALEGVRTLYEKSNMPVREIARLAGVSERRFYVYASKLGWVRTGSARGARAAALSDAEFQAAKAGAQAKARQRAAREAEAASLRNFDLLCTTLVEVETLRRDHPPKPGSLMDRILRRLAHVVATAIERGQPAVR